MTFQKKTDNQSNHEYDADGGGGDNGDDDDDSTRKPYFAEI